MSKRCSNNAEETLSKVTYVEGIFKETKNTQVFSEVNFPECFNTF